MQRSPGSVGVTPIPSHGQWPDVGDVLAAHEAPWCWGARGSRQAVLAPGASQPRDGDRRCVVISAMTGDARGAGLRFGRASWKKRPLC